jgi:predicted Zn-dependent protease
MQGMQLLFLKFSRDNEREADRLGVTYASKIGYDARKMADFFQVLKKMSLPSNQGGVPTFLSTHPDPGDRYNSVNQQAKAWQDSLQLTSWKVNAGSYKQMIDGMVYGEDPRQGYVEVNTFYHPELKFRFTFPAGWQLENLPTQVNMAPADGQALMVFALALGNTLDEAVNSTLDQLGLKPEERSPAIVNGMPSMVTLCRQVSQDQYTGQQQTVVVMSYFIDYDNTFYVFHGVTTEANYPVYAGAFTATMGDFSRLTDPAKLNSKPNRILIKKVPRTGTLADALKHYGMKPDRMEELALLNNLELNDRVPEGSLIKVIGH